MDLSNAEVDTGAGDAGPFADGRRVVPAGRSGPHDNLQPSIGLNCIIALTGWYPSPAQSLSSGFSSSSSTAPSGTPAARSISDPILGEIGWTAFDFAPRGWERCDGQLLPISQREDLFSLLGNRYGGDGVTTFALPDVRGRTVVHEGQGDGLTERSLGSTFGTEQEVANAVSHTHTFDSTAYPSAACRERDAGGEPQTCTDQPLTSTGSGADHDNVQPSIVLNCIIATQGEYPVRSLRRQNIDWPWLGEIRWVPYTFAPHGWEFCDGQIKDVDTESVLFTLLGNRFGGDGVTTFALPDARGRAFVHAGSGPGLTTRGLGSSFGSETVVLTEDQLPSHDHGWQPEGDESRTSLAGGGQPHENVQPSIALNCVMAVAGYFPSPSLRRGGSPAVAAGEPGARWSQSSSHGEIAWVPFDFTPRGWKLCDGELLDISSYQPTFALIGDSYGGNGRVTFALPDARGRTPVHHGVTPGGDGTRWAIADSRGSEFVTLTNDQMVGHAPECAGGRNYTATNLDLRCAELRGADLTTRDLNRADLTAVDLGDAQMYAVDLTGATMIGARLIGTELTETNLTAADLSGADLTGASLVNTNLTGADLTGAILEPSVLVGVIWSNTTCPDGSNSDTNGRDACP